MVLSSGSASRIWEAGVKIFIGTVFHSESLL